jgi:hypothetical protein
MRTSCKTAYIIDARRIIVWLFFLMIGTSVATLAAAMYLKTTVAEILAQPRKFDRKQVELRGKLVLTRENSAFSDGSTCARAKNCALWAEFADCVFLRDGSAPIDCREYLEELVRRKGGASNPQPIEINGVTARGFVATSSKEVKYASSVPKRDRVGRFGHLGAYGGQINVQQLDLSGGAK